jgi:hypothetical protein
VAFETRASRGLVHYFDALYTMEEVARFAVYALFTLWLSRALWQESRASAPEAARAGATA